MLKKDYGIYFFICPRCRNLSDRHSDSSLVEGETLCFDCEKLLNIEKLEGKETNLIEELTVISTEELPCMGENWIKIFLWHKKIDRVYFVMGEINDGYFELGSNRIREFFYLEKLYPPLVRQERKQLEYRINRYLEEINLRNKA